jgi:hypothetical protein
MTSLYNDFSGDLSGWEMYGPAGSVAIVDGRLKLNKADEDYVAAKSPTMVQWGDGYGVRVEFEITTPAAITVDLISPWNYYPDYIEVYAYYYNSTDQQVVVFSTWDHSTSSWDSWEMPYDPDTIRGVGFRNISGVIHFDVFDGTTWSEVYVSPLTLDEFVDDYLAFDAWSSYTGVIYYDNVYADMPAPIDGPVDLSTSDLEMDVFIPESELPISGPIDVSANDIALDVLLEHMQRDLSTQDLVFDVIIAQRFDLTVWDSDLDNQFLLDIGIEARMDVDIAPEPPPSGLVVQPILRKSMIFPAPTLDTFGRPINWVPTSSVDETVGSLQVMIGGHDRTFWNNTICQVKGWQKNEPFDDATAELFYPQVSYFAALPTFIERGFNVQIKLVKPDESKIVLFEGFIIGTTQDEAGVTVEILGILYQADLQLQAPLFYVESQDIGTRIADILNTTVSRDFGWTKPVTTGIKTRQRGSWGQRLTGAIQELLSTAVTDDGSNQWTVMVNSPGAVPVIQLKDRTTHHWTVSAGAPGVQLSVHNDGATVPNVIYGQGTAPDGCVWRNSKYPNLHPDSAPIFPYSPTHSISVGECNDGVQTWEERMSVLGYDVSVNGCYSSSDAAACRLLQKRAGITVDGLVGPQTWAATFDVGANAGSLDGAFFMPLYDWDPVQYYLYNADGSTKGKNPTFDVKKLRVERFETYGEGITKTEGVRAATAEFNREFAPNGANYLGDISLSADPEEGSRFLIDAGENIYVRYFNGTGMLFHISNVDVDLEGGSVRLQVDTKARDLITLTAIKQRNKDATDPARRKSTPRRSKQIDDSVVNFDCEAGAGRIPKHALYKGLWTVIRIPAGQLGTIAKTVFTTSGPAAKFSVGIFGSPITAARLKSLVGNPLSGNGWDQNQDALDDAGLLISWGSADQAMGYYPRSQSDAGASVTGRFIDGASWEWESYHPPWLWIAEYSTSSCFISGRLYAQVDG